MSGSSRCEYCGRPIKKGRVTKVLRGKKHTFCTEFCFRLFFYDVPTISYEDLNKTYALRCVDIKAPAFRTLMVEED